MKHLTSSPELSVKAYSFNEIVYEGKAFSVSATNKIGPLDILPGHANMLTILSDCAVIIETTNGEKQIEISNGILKVSNNSVALFIDL
jgi:F-type H+-transporting ATPase subunit epsilon